MQKIALPLAACLLALAATGVQAQTPWKWRDASGQLHISDTAPPAGTPAKNIISGPLGMVPAAPPALTAVVPGASAPDAAPVAAAKPASTAAETALEKKKNAADKDKAEKEKTDRAALEARNATIRKDNCSRAQSSLATLQSGVRVVRTNATTGEREYLDDATRAAEVKRTQDVIASNCGAAPAGQ